MPRAAILSTREMHGGLTVTVRVSHWYRVRVRIGTWIIRLGVWVLGAKCDVAKLKEQDR